MVTIHYAPGIDWQRRRVNDFSAGLDALGIEHEITSNPTRQSDGPAILLGTTLWRGIERDEGPWLLVDRASWGDPEFVSLVWNGHGRRGDHCVPENYDGSRWERYGLPLAPWKIGERTVLCGQTETYCPWPSLESWYQSHPEATHFRPHPAGKNPTSLPEVHSWADAGMALTLNSSVAVDALIHGVPVDVDDKGGMAHKWGERFGWERRAFFEWLAWTQWSWEEIRAGKIGHLFDQVLA